MTDRHVDCAKHGPALAAFICQHILETLQDETPRGFIWCRDPNGCVNAYCSTCEIKLADVGGEWNDESENFANITMVCEFCAVRAAEINRVYNVKSGEIDR